MNNDQEAAKLACIGLILIITGATALFGWAGLGVLAIGFGGLFIWTAVS